MSDFGFAAQLAEDLSMDDLRLVLRVFRNDMQRLTETLTQTAAAGDREVFRRAAHALAGAAGAVGAAGLERACRQAMAGEDGPTAMLAEIGSVAEAALGDVSRILARLDARP